MIRRRWSKTKMDAFTIHANQAVRPTIDSIEAAIPEEAAVCLETVSGGIWLPPQQPSSSTETPPESTPTVAVIDSSPITMLTPAVCPESVVVPTDPTPFTIATQVVCPESSVDTTFLDSTGCVPGKSNMPFLDSTGWVPESSVDTPFLDSTGSEYSIEAPEPEEVSIPPQLSASPKADLSLAALAMTKSATNSMPKAERQIAWGLRSWKDDKTQWF